MSLITSLVAYWKLDGNSNDSLGTDTGTDTSMSYSAAIINSGGFFNGSASLVDFGNAANLRITGDISIAFWMKLNTTATGHTYGLVTKSNDAAARSYATYIDTNTIVNWQISSNGADPQVAGFVANAAVADTNWHHYVFTASPSTIAFTYYVDGASRAKTDFNRSFGSTIFNSTTAVRLGARGGTATWFLDGDMDEVGIWTKVLTATEAAQLYNSGRGLQYPFSQGNFLTMM